MVLAAQPLHRETLCGMMPFYFPYFYGFSHLECFIIGITMRMEAMPFEKALMCTAIFLGGPDPIQNHTVTQLTSSEKLNSGIRISSPPFKADSWANIPTQVMLADCLAFG